MLSNENKKNKCDENKKYQEKRKYIKKNKINGVNKEDLQTLNIYHNFVKVTVSGFIIN